MIRGGSKIRTPNQARLENRCTEVPVKNFVPPLYSDLVGELSCPAI